MHDKTHRIKVFSSLYRENEYESARFFVLFHYTLLFNRFGKPQKLVESFAIVFLKLNDKRKIYKNEIKQSFYKVIFKINIQKY